MQNTFLSWDREEVLKQKFKNTKINPNMINRLHQNFIFLFVEWEHGET